MGAAARRSRQPCPATSRDIRQNRHIRYNNSTPVPRLIATKSVQYAHPAQITKRRLRNSATAKLRRLLANRHPSRNRLLLHLEGVDARIYSGMGSSPVLLVCCNWVTCLELAWAAQDVLRSESATRMSPRPTSLQSQGASEAPSQGLPRSMQVGGTQGDTPAESRLDSIQELRQAIALWLRWNAAYEQVTMQAYQARHDQRKLEAIMDEMDSVRRQAVAASEKAIGQSP